MLSFAVYSAPFLLVDIIFPVKVQESYGRNISRSRSESTFPLSPLVSEGVNDLSKESNG